jgi:hypothetical protein
MSIRTKSGKLTNSVLVTTCRHIERLAGERRRTPDEPGRMDKFLRLLRDHSAEGRVLEDFLRTEIDRPGSPITTLHYLMELAGKHAPDKSTQDQGDMGGNGKRRADEPAEDSDGDPIPKKGRAKGPDKGEAQNNGAGNGQKHGGGRGGNGGRGDKGGRGDGGGRGGRGRGQDGGRGGRHVSAKRSELGDYIDPVHFSERSRAHACVYCAAASIDGINPPHERKACPLVLAGKPPKDHRPSSGR